MPPQTRIVVSERRWDMALATARQKGTLRPGVSVLGVDGTLLLTRLKVTDEVFLLLQQVCEWDAWQALQN
jgi:hypothetical protein